MRNVTGTLSREDLNRSLNQSENRLREIEKLFYKDEISVEEKFNLIQTIATHFSKLNYSSFTSYLNFKRKEFFDSSLLITRIRNSSPIECFEFSYIINQILIEAGFQEVAVLGTSYKEDNSLEIRHVGVLVGLEEKKYFIDPFNNFTNIVEIADGVEFNDKKGKKYLVSKVTNSSFFLNYISSAGNIKAIQFRTIELSELKNNYDAMTREQKFELRFVKFSNGEPRWITYNVQSKIFSSNVDEINDLKPSKINNKKFLNQVYRHFRDVQLIYDINGILRNSN